MAQSQHPRVSILIPVWNGEASIDRSIESAARQTLADLEIIVIDDASTDGTVDRVQRWIAQDPRVKLVRAKVNSGPGAARTLGLSQCVGDWVAILDADDTMAEHRIARLTEEAEKDNLDAIADNIALFDPGLKEVVGRAFPLAENEHVDITIETFLENVRPGARVNLGWMQPVVRRDFLSRHNIEWPDIRHAEDMVFTSRLLLSGARLRLVGRADYLYTQRRGSVSGHASPLSRTTRSVSEQHRALELIEADCLQRNEFVRRRLSNMHGEISATTHALNFRDALAERQKLEAARHFVTLGRFPFALSRCLWTRYAMGSRIKQN